MGKIYQAIPWDDLVKSFDLVESKMGHDCIFSPQGKLALIFLKNYACCSDQRLMEQFNSNIHYQLFCCLLLGVDEQINQCEQEIYKVLHKEKWLSDKVTKLNGTKDKEYEE